MRETLLSYLPDLLNRGEDRALIGCSGLRTVYWSYRQLAQTSFQVAQELASRGLGEGEKYRAGDCEKLETPADGVAGSLADLPEILV